MAIASAVLQQLVQQTRCKTLFITHYPEIALELERSFPSAVENVHMGYMEEQRIDGTRTVTFLYKLTPGITTNSFGVECARLAGVPEEVLLKATSQADRMRAMIEQRSRRNKCVVAAEFAYQMLTHSPGSASVFSLCKIPWNLHQSLLYPRWMSYAHWSHLLSRKIHNDRLGFVHFGSFLSLARRLCIFLCISGYRCSFPLARLRGFGLLA